MAKILGTNKSFAERLSVTKSVFQKALEDAKTLQQDMAAKVHEKTIQIATIESEIRDINIVEDETKRFISNLEGLL